MTGSATSFWYITGVSIDQLFLGGCLIMLAGSVMVWGQQT